MSNERLEAKVDKIIEKVASIDTTLAKQEVNLALHMRRSDALEAQIEPIKQHVAMVAGAMKLLKWVAGTSFGSAIAHAILHYVMKVY
jgi:hypothetical protein